VLQNRRIQAISLLKEGYQPVDVAKIVGVDRRSVRRWNAAYKTEGQKGIEANPAPGRPPKLNTKDKKKLEKALLKGAMAAGYTTDLWTCPRVARLIENLFGVNYHAHHVSKLLHSLGWTPQKPQRIAKERNEKEIRRWIKEEWPRIKKKRQGSKPLLSS
jgi:transposase